VPLHFSGSSSPYNLTVSDARELFGFQYLAGISDLNFIFGENHMAAALSCQSQIAMAVVEWHHGSFGSSADWLGLVLASSQLRRVARQ
jgi:hypothetical protein